jgi:hypothetical protein
MCIAAAKIVPYVWLLQLQNYRSDFLKYDAAEFCEKCQTISVSI